MCDTNPVPLYTLTVQKWFHSEDVSLHRWIHCTDAAIIQQKCPAREARIAITMKYSEILSRLFCEQIGTGKKTCAHGVGFFWVLWYTVEPTGGAMK